MQRKQAVAQADKSVRNVKSINIDYFQATVEGGQINNYRVNAKISIVLD